MCNSTIVYVNMCLFVLLCEFEKQSFELFTSRIWMHFYSYVIYILLFLNCLQKSKNGNAVQIKITVIILTSLVANDVPCVYHPSNKHAIKLEAENSRETLIQTLIIIDQIIGDYKRVEWMHTMMEI